MCWVLEIDEMNGLICVEIDRLMHELRVLAGCHNYMEYNCVYRPFGDEIVICSSELIWVMVDIIELPVV